MFWDLHRVIISQRDGLPVDWAALSPSGRILAEIGFGNGEFLEYLAAANPDALTVGIEVSQWCAAKGARRLLSAGLSNARVMQGDARFLLRRCFSQESVERVYMNFPCPWPKTRHASRRVAVPAFAGLMDYLIAPGGAFELATDVDWYAEDAAKVFASVPSFRAEPIEKNPARPYVTKYERKWKAMGKDVWRLVVKKEEKSRALYENGEDWEMEGEAETKKNVRDVAEALRGLEGAGVGGQGRWVFRDAYYSGDDVALLLVITSDEGFEQHFYLKVLRNPRGVTIKVDSVGRPYRTPAMRAALLEALAKAKD